MRQSAGECSDVLRENRIYLRSFADSPKEGRVRICSRLRPLAALLSAIFLLLGANPAAAAVEITFYSKELGTSFPHAFVVVDGTLDRTGERISEDFGFSAKTISPAILLGRVKGEVLTDHKPDYVRASDKHFSVILSDEEYDRVVQTVERWRSAKQPSYSLDKANCIHFVGEIATAIGLDGSPRKGLMRRPRSFLEAVTDSNRTLLTTRGAVFHRNRSPDVQSGA
jgi:hypothetical protein